jgi:hypothetical protein
MTEDRLPGPETDGVAGLPMRCVVVGGSLVGLSAAIALSRLGHGIDRDGTAWHLLQRWLGEHAARLPGVSVRRGIQVQETAAYLAHATRRTAR